MSATPRLPWRGVSVCVNRTDEFGSGGTAEPASLFPLTGRQATMPVTAAASIGANSAPGFFSASLAEADPEIADAIAKELGRQQHEIELIASENIVSQGGARGAGLGADQQVRRGLSGQALLRRLRVRRRRRDAGDRARQEAVRRGLRQRPAELRQPDEPGGVPGAARAGRHLHGPRPRRRRPPDPRLAGQHVRQVVQGRALRRAPRRPAARLRRGRAHRARGQAEADHRRRHRLFALSGTSSASARSPTRSAPT